MGVHPKGLLLSIIDLFHVQNAEIFGFSQSPYRNYNIHCQYKTCSASKYSIQLSHPLKDALLCF